MFRANRRDVSKLIDSYKFGRSEICQNMSRRSIREQQALVSLYSIVGEILLLLTRKNIIKFIRNQDGSNMTPWKFGRGLKKWSVEHWRHAAFSRLISPQLELQTKEKPPFYGTKIPASQFTMPLSGRIRVQMGLLM